MPRYQLLIAALLSTTVACAPGGVNTSNNDDGTGFGPDGGLPVDGRIVDGLAALYRFDEGIGNTVYDLSDKTPALDLTIETPGSVSWIEGGLSVNAPALIKTAGSATRLNSACQSANAITVEAWVRAGNLDQTGPARILDLSNGPASANLVLGQSAALAEARLRTSDTPLDGDPTDSQAAAFTTLPIHLVYSRSGLTDEAKLYVNGSTVNGGTLAGSFANWDLTYPLTVANEPGGNRPWRGELFLVAVYCRALSAAEVERNYVTGY